MLSDSYQIQHAKPRAVPAAVLDRVRQLESSSRYHGVVPTGWEDADRALPGGGLGRGAVHEWASDRAPPLTVLIHLAARAAGKTGWMCWVGRSVWPYGHSLARAGLLERSLLVDVADPGELVWAMDCALRCTGMVVVGDATGLDMACSRRLQLAAESGGSVAFVARPGREALSLSAAATRWVVSRPPAAGGGVMAWMLRLARCKGASDVIDREFTVERTSDARLVAVPAALAGRSRASAAGA